MKNTENQPANHVEIHPISVREIKKGHPWIIADKFTSRFPANKELLIATDKGKPICLFLNDPKHKKVKGRVWSFKQPFHQEIHNFHSELYSRLDGAIIKRKELQLKNERDNFYLAFGESDLLPGLFIQALGEDILIQLYANFWETYQSLMVKYLKKILAVRYPELGIKSFWIQKRGDPKNKNALPKPMEGGRKNKKNIVNEFNINYQLKLGMHYDTGIYTDMAAIRKEIAQLIKTNDHVLNLFSYSGAYSLLALKQQAQKVVSVDSAQMSIEWLEENLKLNPQLDSTKHQSFTIPVQKYLSNANKHGEKFDIIICDPPSSSADGKKITSVLQFYEKELPKMIKLLNDEGKLCLFVNTHTTPHSKFSKKIKQILELSKIKNVKIKKNLSLREDCPTRPHFEEGSYLKGIILEKSATN